ncbi:GDP-mannose 4,6-dehydratase [Planctomycetota bacterium]
MKNILVTGAGGFIGSHLCEILVQAGYKVQAFVHYNSRNYCGWLEDSAFRDEIEVQMGDIRDFDTVSSAVSKADAICQLALSYAFSFEMPVTVIRPFNTYGPRQSLRAVIPTIISQMASNKDAIELGNISPKRDLTYVADTCSGFVKALETDKVAGKVLNLGTGETISIKMLAEKIMSLMGRSVEIITKDDRIRPKKSEVRCLQSDNCLAKKLLGWEPEVSLEQGLSKTIEFIQNNMSAYNSNGYII